MLIYKKKTINKSNKVSKTIKILDNFFYSNNNNIYKNTSSRHKISLEEVNRVLGGGLVDSL